MEFHENLQDLATKEGLKGRKLHKAVESFTWNITILKVRGFPLKAATAPVPTVMFASLCNLKCVTSHIAATRWWSQEVRAQGQWPRAILSREHFPIILVMWQFLLEAVQQNGFQLQLKWKELQIGPFWKEKKPEDIGQSEFQIAGLDRTSY